MTASRCRSCGAPIVWARTVKGKSMPVDAAPAEGGNVELVPEPTGSAMRAIVHGQAPLGGPPLHFSHFATCEDASWRSSARRGAGV